MPAPRRGGVDLGETEEGESHEYLTWRWWPTLGALRTHHIYEVGFIACTIQLFGATLYSWCGLVSLRGISSEWTANATWYGGYWFPEVFGSCCFLFASVSPSNEQNSGNVTLLGRCVREALEGEAGEIDNDAN